MKKIYWVLLAFVVAAGAFLWYAKNKLVIIYSTKNPAGKKCKITAFADLTFTTFDVCGVYVGPPTEQGYISMQAVVTPDKYVLVKYYPATDVLDLNLMVKNQLVYAKSVSAK